MKKLKYRIHYYFNSHRGRKMAHIFLLHKMNDGSFCEISQGTWPQPYYRDDDPYWSGLAFYP